MKRIGITMRADQHPDFEETRDALDQRWLAFFGECHLIPILLPNSVSWLSESLTDLGLAGIVLSGGNSPVKFGGHSPERDAVDNYLIQWAVKHNIPLLGVCRGMQSIQLAYQQPLEQVVGHVCKQQCITIKNEQIWVNSYHTIGAKRCLLPLQSWANSADGVIKAISHNTENIHGMMWHPERSSPFSQHDINFFKQVFS